MKACGTISVRSTMGNAGSGRMPRPKPGKGGVRAVLVCGVSLLAAGQCICAAAQTGWRFDSTLWTDYRSAQLDWNIAGSLAGTTPNILSELTWSDLQIAQVGAALQLTARERLVLQGRAVYGAVFSGKNQDSDYNGDNRTQEFLRSNSKGGGEIGEGSIAVGYLWRWYAPAAGGTVRVTPLLGYARDLQYLTIRDGRQTIPVTGVIANLDSNYNAEWSGPWLGVNLRLAADARTAVIIQAEYHRADYYAEANWNLRDDLAHPVSFTHSTRGAGYMLSMAFSHAVARRWELIARTEAQYWLGRAGVDTLYTLDKATQAVQPTATRLNEVRWQSLSVGLAASYRF